MKRLALTLLFGAAAAGLACSATPNLLPVNDLNRPQDVTFMCFGAYGPTDGNLTVSGRPMRVCHPQDLYDPAATATSRTFAFMPQSGSGGLTVVDADHWKLIDLAAQTGGYGQAPLGALPSQVSASDDGCRLLTANRGSCDLSLVDPSVLVAPTFALANRTDVPSPRTATMTIRPLKSDGTFLTAAPYEAVFLPQNTSKLVKGALTDDAADPGPLCGADAAAVEPQGWPEASGPVPWYALVTYPSCDLVAVIALPSGQIVSSAHVKPASGPDGNATVTLVDAGTAPSCPVDCAGQAVGPATTSDAGTAIATPDASADAAPIAAGGAAGAPGDAATSTAADASADAGLTGAAGQLGTGMAGAGAGGQGGMAGVPGNQYPDPPYVSGTRALGPSGIAILPDGTRAYISLANASYVLSVGLSSAGLGLPGNAVYLHEGARGALRVRLNVDPYRYLSNAGQAGVFVGAETAASQENSDALSHGMTLPEVGKRKYLYVIAQDGTVRVVSVFLPGAETECETNIDPMNLPAGVSAGTACIPVDPAHRRPFSVGPGIHVPGLPVDVAAADVRVEPTEDHTELSVNGAHAWVLTDLGAVYLVNINPVLRQYAAAVMSNNYAFTPTTPNVTEPEPFVNTLRDRNQITYSVTLDPASGPPRVDVLPSTPSTGPYVEPFWTQGAEWNPTALTKLFVQTGVFFPRVPDRLHADDPIDRRAVTAQEWTVTWQGALGGGHSTGVLYGTGQAPFPADPKRPQLLAADALLLDNGANYCGQGVTAGDLVTLTGCTQNNQCGLGEICLLDETVSSASAGLPINGLCADPNRTDATAANCAAFLQTIRRYEIAAAYPNRLVIRPHLDELARSSLRPCDPNKNAPANGATAAPSPDAGALEDTSPDVCPDPNDPSTDNFRCLADPEGGTTPRCLVQCNSTTACRAGRICVDLNSDKLPTPAECDTKPCFCADAPPFTPSAKMNCFDQLTSYQIQVGKGFLVSGSQSGFMATASLPRSGDEQCAADPAGDPRFTFRIPMSAPACTSLPAPVTQFDTRVDPDSYAPDSDEYNALAAANLQLVNALTTPPAPADPCLFLGGPVQGDPLTFMTLPQHVRALFRNAQLTFVLANLDRGPTGQFSTAFDVHGGFAPQAVQDPATVEVSMPARIVYGPIDAMTQMTPFTMTQTEERYLFVVDQRRLGRSQGGAPTRGQLLRIHPLGYSTTVGSSPTGSQPIFQDYNASGGLFPIQ
ncbi:MAG TPA: hypothetical protein VN962_20440 [Polyangia bacterium]|nr:hypothetical protein [Polyangia bacterium]